MKYMLIKIWLWLVECGWRGAKLVLFHDRASKGVVQIRSRTVGKVCIRNCVEDVEVINTVLCFKAYSPGKGVPRPETVIDLGANIGIATRYFMAIWPGARVVAVEPSRDNIVILQMNVRTGKGSAVELVEGAVGAQSGKGRLLAHPSGRLDGGFIDVSGADIEGQAVEVIGLAGLLRQAPKPIVVKMDIEGMEHVLLEDRASWIDMVELLMVEIHGPEMEKKWVEILAQDGWSGTKRFDTWHFAKRPAMSGESTVHAATKM